MSTGRNYCEGGYRKPSFFCISGYGFLFFFYPEINANASYIYSIFTFHNYSILNIVESDEVRKKVPYQLDVPYGVGEREKFDIYGADSLPTGTWIFNFNFNEVESYHTKKKNILDAPVFVYIHGGYWHLLDRFMSAYCVEPLYKAGIITIILGFEVAPKGTLIFIKEVGSWCLLAYTHNLFCGYYQWKWVKWLNKIKLR